MGVKERLAELGLALPEPPAAAANYVPWVRSGDLIFLSGHVPNRAGGGLAYTGKVGGNLTLEEGYAAARFVTLNLLATLQAAAGDLDRFVRIVKVTGYVNAVAGFTDQPKVLNGCSDLLIDLFGERGRHARSAVGCADLPLGVPVEIELIAQV
jgi:enamine deaminase RidA (YjgF/YER057c/UK114 family)